jgi:menaquinone-dependent protoporphyrinogen oxidase
MVAETVASRLKEITMFANVLVAYTTRYGSTQEVAEAIGETLRGCGLKIDIKHLRDVRSLLDYEAVVLGAPIFYARWHKDAHHFLSLHRQALAQRPVAVFALGPLDRDEKQMAGSRETLNKALLNFPWLAPVDVEVFIGRYDPTKLRFPDSLLLAIPASPLKKLPASDMRDWTAIRGWAGNLAAKLQRARHLPMEIAEV